MNFDDLKQGEKFFYMNQVCVKSTAYVNGTSVDGYTVISRDSGRFGNFFAVENQIVFRVIGWTTKLQKDFGIK